MAPADDRRAVRLGVSPVGAGTLRTNLRTRQAGVGTHPGRCRFEADFALLMAQNAISAGSARKRRGGPPQVAGTCSGCVKTYPQPRSPGRFPDRGCVDKARFPPHFFFFLFFFFLFLFFCFFFFFSCRCYIYIFSLVGGCVCVLLLLFFCCGGEERLVVVVCLFVCELLLRVHTGNRHMMGVCVCV